MSVLIVGKNSFIAEHLQEYLVRYASSLTWKAVSHEQIDTDASFIGQFDTIINFAYHPDLRGQPYDAGKDLDVRIAERLGPKAHYIMVSSRMVYGDKEGLNTFQETDPVAPSNTYGVNKATTEKQLAGIIDAERLTILRMGNIFGYEPGRKSFMGAALDSLKSREEIILDLSPKNARDFLPVENTSAILQSILKKPVGGIFNIGSGFATTCGDIAQWIIDGYGSGKITYTGQSNKGQFALDRSKLDGVYQLGQPVSEDIKSACQECGRKLRRG